MKLVRNAYLVACLLSVEAASADPLSQIFDSVKALDGTEFSFYGYISLIPGRRDVALVSPKGSDFVFIGSLMAGEEIADMVQKSCDFLGFDASSIQMSACIFEVSGSYRVLKIPSALELGPEVRLDIFGVKS